MRRVATRAGGALAWSALALLGCDEPEEIPQESAPPMEFQFAFAILADPHVTTDVDHQERLAAAVDWVNANAAERDIELVWVVGDIGWGEGLPIARDLLSELEPIWLPVLGDNEVVFGDEQNFGLVFDEQMRSLASTLPGWTRGAVEVENPVYEQTSWMHNFAFDYGGLRWIGLDWCSRSDNALLSELGELQDFEGGTLPYLSQELSALSGEGEEDILLFSHHPMHVGMFSDAQMRSLIDLIGPQAGRVSDNYAGHTHVNAEVEVEEGGYTVWVTDAVWDDVNTVRVVGVYSDGSRYEYTQELVIVP